LGRVGGKGSFSFLLPSRLWAVWVSPPDLDGSSVEWEPRVARLAKLGAVWVVVEKSGSSHPNMIRKTLFFESCCFLFFYPFFISWRTGEQIGRLANNLGLSQNRFLCSMFGRGWPPFPILLMYSIEIGPELASPITSCDLKHHRSLESEVASVDQYSLWS
jgi:hypothetical protein